MSRNCAGGTNCQVCDGHVLHEEAERPIARKEAGPYFEEYEGMLVANAHCRDCEAKYLAWVRGPKSWTYGHMAWSNYTPNGHVDLSYRSTFNDEPGEADKPVYEIRRCRVAKDGTVTLLEDQ